MDDRCFIDTNVWVYRFVRSKDNDDLRKREIAKTVIEETSEIVISVQILNEFSNVMIRKFNAEITVVRQSIEQILSIAELTLLTEETTFKALELMTQYSLSFYDGLIVVAALDADCKRLATEDLQNGLTIQTKLAVENPFINLP